MKFIDNLSLTIKLIAFVLLLCLFSVSLLFENVPDLVRGFIGGLLLAGLLYIALHIFSARKNKAQY